MRNLILFTTLSFSLLILAACGQEAPPPPPPPEPAAQEDPFAGLFETPPAPVMEPGRLVVQPNPLVFDPTPASGQSKRVVLATNDGDKDLRFNELRVIGQDFTLAGSCVVGRVLKRGEFCDIEVTYTPAQVEISSAEMVITHDGEGSPLFVTLRGQKAASPQALAAEMQALAAFSPEPVFSGPSPELLYSVEMTRRRQEARMNTQSAPSQRYVVANLADPDYAAIGFEPTLSTFPVDRSRIITADRYIPVVLENSINSQIPGGRVVAVVERHVYGGDGRAILLPAGSRAVGYYGSLGRTGNSRLVVQWVRIMRPDGVAVAIDDPGADAMGRLGLVGHVDLKMWERYGVPLLISLIDAATTLGTASTRTLNSSPGAFGGTVQTVTETERAEEQAAEQLVEDVGDITQRFVEENIDLSPVITIPAGTRFYILPTKDIVFKGPDQIVALSQAQLDAAKQGAGGVSTAP